MLLTARIPVAQRSLSILLVLCLLFFSVLCPGAEAASAYLVPENNAVPQSQSSSYRDVEIRTPAGRYIDAMKYTGSSTPSSYPNASSFDVTLLKSSSYHYNCHGFAWFFSGSTSGITNANSFWMNSYAITQYVQHGCHGYISLSSSSTTCDQLVESTIRSKLRVGDIVLYLNGDGVDSLAAYSHSAVITSIGSSGIYAVSKWGEYGVYRHKVDSCPYAQTGYIGSGGAIHSGYAQVVVYRPLHSNANNTISPATDDSVTYALPSFISIDDTSHKAVCDCGRGYDVENHNFTQITVYRYECYDCGHIYDSSIGVNSSPSDKE